MSDFIPWLQSRLTSHGYPVGLIDGAIGPITIAALKAFQVSRGLPSTGRADELTVKRLRETSSGIIPRPDLSLKDQAQLPLDLPKVSHIVWPRESECMSFFGPVGTSQVSVEVPFDFYLAWSTSTRIKKITVHSKVAASAERVLNRIAGIYSPIERRSLGIDLFGGSLNVRRKRGGTSWSMHSWGIAIDFDPELNQLDWHKPRARLSHPEAISFWKEWEAEGWLSLGRARDFDWMHVQAARI